MKSFFSGFNFARFIILVCFLGAAPLGYMAWKQHQKNEEMKAALAPDGEVEQLVAQIQENSKVYTKLMKDKRSEGLMGEQADVQSYIRKKAFGDQVDLGQIVIDPSRPRTVSPGVQDTNYKVRPQDRERAYERTAIANFLFTLEGDSRRVRVTELRIEHEEPRLKPETIPDRDRWKFEAQVTTRQKIEK